ncbi:sporulation integral membrane protein YlbJ [Calidifontibacillus erzurumensis]|uniref:Sporulation integral membrane protein YlbJ n=1 Tax=Calidifontibacillus erzurumensis TaxID=2741433 RepID=A0A8J8GC21_9BACI|nr:sporulation integral membrane protein YlbJ [Calidifontibacillus erzurumensis]NSL50759.1 sporulation integral membrane protein YlbJ [Calidifontibacillus erzurumensis]
MTRSKLKTILLAISISLVAFGLIFFPKESLEASKRGLQMWWEVVFPSLLPFFIVSELLIGYGVVKFIGFLLEPFMRPLFKVPGIGGVVWAMGMASGFPAGAKLTTRLRQEKLLTRIEAERLVSFTNSSNPLFIFGAVSVGFFNNANIGILLAISHYLGNFCVGLMMRFYGRNEKEEDVSITKKTYSLKEAFKILHETRMKNQKPIGKMLGDAVTSSIQTLLLIGGFIILFSVFNRLLYIVNITELAAHFLGFVLAIFHFSTELALPLFSGMFEITLGSQLTSQVEDVDLYYKVVITSFILAFSGFSVQAQVASILAQTDIRFQPFFLARVMHGFFSAFFAYLLWKPLYVDMYVFGNDNAVPAAGGMGLSIVYSYWDFILQYGALVTIFSLIICILISIKTDRQTKDKIIKG